MAVLEIDANFLILFVDTKRRHSVPGDSGTAIFI